GPDAPATIGTRYQIGSVSKWIASVAVLRLVDQGKLKLDTPIAAYLPELPKATGDAVTLRHLLSNASGVPNGVSAAFKLDRTVGDLQLSPLAASVRFSGGALEFAPGTAWNYSPTNWVLVAAIVERAGGASFAEVIAREVLQPAGAGATGVPMGELDALPAMALAYGAAVPRVRKTTPNNPWVVAAGSIYSTAQDLMRLADAVYEGSLLSPASRAELSRVQVAAEDYALGGRVRSWTVAGGAHTIAYLSGVSGGFKSLLVHVPGEAKSVVILNNTDMQQADVAKAAQALLETLYR
ncbi:MAG TPA: serine hydrolase domain-containing protein, partial [Burkholderiaceae bacterium]